jgi:hypothetical protein
MVVQRTWFPPFIPGSLRAIFLLGFRGLIAALFFVECYFDAARGMPRARRSCGVGISRSHRRSAFAACSDCRFDRRRESTAKRSRMCGVSSFYKIKII